MPSYLSKNKQTKMIQLRNGEMQRAIAGSSKISFRKDLVASSTDGLLITFKCDMALLHGHSSSQEEKL